MPPLTRFALGSLVVLVVLLTAGALPAFSSPTPAGHGSLTITRLAAADRTAPGRPMARHGVVPLRVKDAAVYRRDKAAAAHRYEWRQSHGVVATLSTSHAAGPLTSIFHSLDAPGITDATTLGVTPSDATGAIGPSNYVEFINSEIAVYDNTDLTTAPETLDESTFVGDPSAFTCDVQIQWDEQGQRWLYAALDCGEAKGSAAEGFYFGWSKTPSPSPLTTNWCQYRIDTGASFEDYPKLGHDDSQIIVGTNAFADDGFGDYTASHIFVFDKPTNGVTSCPSGAAEGSTAIEATTNASDFTPVPANIADDSATGYVAAATSYADQSHIDLYTVGRNGAGANAVLGMTAVTVPAFDFPGNVPQPTTSDVIDSSDTRLTQAVATTDPLTGKEGIWTQHTVAGSGAPSVVRWYELEPGRTTPERSGTVSGPSGTYAFNGAISPTENGSSAVLNYNSGDGTHLVDWRAQDPLASTVDDIQLATSTDPDEDFSCTAPDGPPCRWGDYAGASPDPANPCVAWGTTMLTVTAPDVGGDAQWGTQNAAVDTSNGTCEVTAGVLKAGSGSGTVASSPGGIDCGATCSHAYDAGIAVTLTATAAAGSVFSGWSGDCSGTGACTLTLDKARSVTATFASVPETLSVTKAGSGSGTVSSSPAGISCGSACSQAFTFGTSVTLAATPAAGSVFSGWSGACSGTGSCTVGMTQAQAVTATFALLPETLTVTKSGSGTVTSSPVGISCGPTCSQAFAFGTSVTLSRTPASGWLFKGWSGACSGTGVCSVTMSGAQSVHATFAKKTACVVPKLKGKTLKAAKRALTRAHCRAGKITKKYSRVKSGRVISQKPRPGKHLRVGARVNLTVSKGKKP